MDISGCSIRQAFHRWSTGRSNGFSKWINSHTRLARTDRRAACLKGSMHPIRISHCVHSLQHKTLVSEVIFVWFDGQSDQQTPVQWSILHHWTQQHLSLTATATVCFHQTTHSRSTLKCTQRQVDIGMNADTITVSTFCAKACAANESHISIESHIPISISTLPL